MADTLPQHLKHLRAQSTRQELAPDQQTLELEPLAAPGSVSSGSRLRRRSFLSGIGATGLLAGAAPLAAAAPVIAPVPDETTDAAGTKSRLSSVRMRLPDSVIRTVSSMNAPPNPIS